MIKNKHFLLLLFLCSLTLVQTGWSQNGSEKKTVLALAHDKKIKTDEFVKTDLKLFNAKVFSVAEASANKTHHWFLQLLDLDEQPINYAEVEVSGYFKEDPSIKFKYMNPVFKLCSEGKYIIGFVKVKNNGTWVLNATIDDFGKKDSFTYEIKIGEEVQ